MSDSHFPERSDLLRDVVVFGLDAVNDYLLMSGDAGGWQVPECWLQTEIARKLRSKYGIYIWLELPVARVLEWESEDPNKPLILEGDRNGGRFDIGLFSATEKPSDATFEGVIELKRHILNGSECVYDALRIAAMRAHFELCGIVGGMFIGDTTKIRAGLIASLRIPDKATDLRCNPEDYIEGYSYGFIAALV